MRKGGGVTMDAYEVFELAIKGSGKKHHNDVHVTFVSMMTKKKSN